MDRSKLTLRKKPSNKNNMSNTESDLELGNMNDEIPSGQRITVPQIIPINFDIGNLDEVFENDTDCQEINNCEIARGKNGKINGDNLDIYVTTNDIRMTNKNKDYNCFASDWTAHRVNLHNLVVDKRPLLNVPVTHDLFLLSKEEAFRFINIITQR
ncbi:unnamed protein product [Mytilus edulis]|uniref:Uncharacterized protein n=1 Tax=Mytilus edulis TaxID=6550 RepID=A0A8S3SNJ0_MYTED|nr:unnamed protein product [Mytilus edulis]